MDPANRADNNEVTAPDTSDRKFEIIITRWPL